MAPIRARLVAGSASSRSSTASTTWKEGTSSAARRARLASPTTTSVFNWLAASTCGPIVPQARPVCGREGAAPPPPPPLRAHLLQVDGRLVQAALLHLDPEPGPGRHRQGAVGGKLERLLQQVLREIAIAGRGVAREVEAGQRGQRQVGSASDSGLQHPAAPNRPARLAAGVVKLGGGGEKARTPPPPPSLVWSGEER